MKQAILDIIMTLLIFVIMGCNLWCVIYGGHHIMNMVGFFVLIPAGIIGLIDIIKGRYSIH